MKILHISDLHICEKHFPENSARTRKIFEAVEENRPDHLVITGDISDNARWEDHYAFIKLLQDFGYYDPERASIVIGNHDIFGGVQLATDIFTFPSRCRTVNYRNQVEKFYRIYNKLFQNCYFPDPHSPFPFVKDIGKYSFIGLNSIAAYSARRNPLASNGEIDSRQMFLLEKLFNTPSVNENVKIILLHHHLNKTKSGNIESRIWNLIEKNTMKIHGRKKLRQLFADNDVSLVLHGHTHHFEEYYFEGVPFVNGGATIKADTGDHNINYNLIEMDDKKTNIQMYSIAGHDTVEAKTTKKIFNYKPEYAY